MRITSPGVYCITSKASAYIFGISLLSLINTNLHEPVVSTIAQPLPPVPATGAEAAQDNLNQRPVFFGCNPTNTQAPEWPLLIYIPNAPPSDGASPVTNTDTLKLSYTDEHTLLFLEQAFNSTTSGFVPGELGPDPEWPTCLQCAAVDRQRYKQSNNGGGVLPRSAQCEACFTRYCFDPANPPSADQLATPGRQVTFVDPDPQPSFWEKNKKLLIIVGSAVGGVVLLVLVICVGCCCRICIRKRQLRDAWMGKDGYERVQSES